LFIAVHVFVVLDHLLHDLHDLHLLRGHGGGL
jgi:hypothetical protein